MKLQMLEDAVKTLQDRGIWLEETAEEMRQALEEIAEFKALYEVNEMRQLCKDEVQLVSSVDLVMFQNYALYDEYGQMYAATSGNVTFEHYKQVARLYFDHLSQTALKAGYETIRDLYAENEANGCHDARGRFIHEN